MSLIKEVLLQDVVNKHPICQDFAGVVNFCENSNIFQFSVMIAIEKHKAKFANLVTDAPALTLEEVKIEYDAMYIHLCKSKNRTSYRGHLSMACGQ